MAFGATQGAQLLTTWINPRFIAALERDLVAQKFTTKAVIPPGMGKVGRVVTFSNAPGTSATLPEPTFGTISNNVDITVTGTNITISEEGEFMQVNKLQEYASAAGTREEILKRFAHGGRVRIDSLVLAQFALNTTNIYATNGAQQNGLIVQGQAGTSVLGAFNAAAIIAARKVIRTTFAQGFYGLAGHPEGAYACIIGEQASLDMVTEVTAGRITWTNSVVNVPGKMGQEKWVSGYIGSVYGTAVYTSQNVSSGLTYSASNASHAFVTGDGSVAALAFEDMEPQVFVNTPNQNSTDNPYRNLSTVAWHANFGTKIHDMTRSVKIYTLGS